MPPESSRCGKSNLCEGVYGAAVGLFLALSLLKWGNPVIMDSQIDWPSTFAEWRVGFWPVMVGYVLFAVIAVASALRLRLAIQVPSWYVGLPIVWFVLQLIAAWFSIEPSLSWVVVPHFGVCVGLFLMGLCSFANVTYMKPFWLALVGGFFIVAIVGWHQHFIGLEEMRRLVYSLPNWRELPPEFLKKLESDRIYSTLVYPNALAAVVLLLSPVALAMVSPTRTRTSGGKWLGLVLVGLLSAGCLIWSGSKSGWLIALAQVGGYLLSRANVSRQRLVISLIVLLAGLLGFAVRYHDYFARGASSLSARIDYWSACVVTITASPLVGSGPGTFPVYYKNLKTADAEMTRLAHNDYLQQAADSGIFAAFIFLAFWAASLSRLYRNRTRSNLNLGVFYGVLGVSIQSLVEFGLYIPGVAWATWFLIGWGCKDGNPVDKSSGGS